MVCQILPRKTFALLRIVKTKPVVNILVAAIIGEHRLMVLS